MTKSGTVRVTTEEYQQVEKRPRDKTSDVEALEAPPAETAGDEDLAENHLLPVLSDAIGVKTLEKYDTLGIKTVGDLSRADEKDLKSRTGLKIALIRGHIQTAKNYIAARAHGE